MSILESLSAVFFPKQCPVCGKILVKGEKIFCTTCLYDIPWTDPQLSQNNDLLEKMPADIRPERIFSLFHYHTGSKTKNLLYAIKYHNRPGLAREIGKYLGQHITDQLHGDLIIPVPLHKKRFKERGYNQAAEIARGLSEVTGIPVNEKILSRHVYTASQTRKNAADRKKAMEHAFYADSTEAIKNKNIIIVDDIITTGSTIIACMKALAAAGAGKSTLVCLARTSL